MDFSYTPEQEAFRRELRAWLEPSLHEHREQWGEDEDEFVQHPSSAASLAWHKRMYEGGWVGLNSESLLPALWDCPSDRLQMGRSLQGRWPLRAGGTLQAAPELFP